jgi:hypothetical protein
MAVMSIRTPSGVPSSRQRVVLDGRTYVLDLRWSQSEERWYLDVRDQAAIPLALAIPLVRAFPLLAGRRGGRPALPPGELVVLDPTPGPHRAAVGLDELGSSAELVYLDAAEVASMAAARASSSTSAAASGGGGGGGDPVEFP